VGAGKGVASHFSRTARPETPQRIGVSGVGVVEFPRKIPLFLPVLPEQAALMGGTCRRFGATCRQNVPSEVYLPAMTRATTGGMENCLQAAS